MLRRMPDTPLPVDAARGDARHRDVRAEVDRTRQSILQAIAEPFDVHGHEVRITPSIGVSLYPRDGTDVHTLLRNADLAMYTAKELGRNDLAYYDTHMSDAVRSRIALETDLRRALVSHGDPFCFELVGERAAFERMAREVPLLRGYTDAFGHAMVVAGSVDAMVDVHLNPWDAAATRVLVTEAGGACRMARYADGKCGLVFGSPPLVEILSGWLASPPR